MENNLSHDRDAQPPQPASMGTGTINNDDNFAFVGTDFLLAAAAELERRAALVQQGGGTPVQGGRTPQRSRAGSVADQVEDENYESHGQGSAALRPEHAQPPPLWKPPRQARRSLPLDLPALEAGTETLVEASLREQLVLQREQIALMEKQLQLQQLLQQQQSANAATSTASPAPSLHTGRHAAGTQQQHQSPRSRHWHWWRWKQSLPHQWRTPLLHR